MSRPDDESDEPTAGEHQDEVLVAYLDGQLPADESERIENRLADDPAVRERLQSLDRVWNALDVLPRSTASPAFTRSTVEMAAVSAEEPESRPKGCGWRPPLGAIVVVLGLACGAAASLAMFTAPERRALRELPVALHADALENLGSLAFAEQLLEKASKPLDLFSSQATADEALLWAELSRMTPVERRVWLEEQPVEVVAEVGTAVDRFEDRAPLQQESLRDLSREIVQHERATDLLDAALAYQAMVGRRTSGEQAELRQRDPAERLAVIQRSAKSWAFQAAMELSKAERATFRAAAERLVASDEFRRVGERFSRRLPGGRERPTPSPWSMLLGATRSVASDPLSRWPKTRREFANERERIEAWVEGVQRQWRAWFDTLSASLPERVRKALDRADSDVPRARLFERLLRESMTEDLRGTFAELSNDEMQEALLVSRDEFVERLSGSEEPLGDFFGPPSGGPPGFEGRRGPTGGRGFRGGGPPGGPPPRGDRRGGPSR